MKLLIVSQYFWPESFIISDLVRTLRDQGHTVVVATGKPNYPDGRVFDGYRAGGTQRERHRQSDSGSYQHVQDHREEHDETEQQSILGVSVEKPGQQARHEDRGDATGAVLGAHAGLHCVDSRSSGSR